MSPSRTMSMGLVGALAALLLIQAVPYGRRHTNPTATAALSWDSPRTRELAARACFDCHSHETRWPWYASVAPLSWRIQSNVTGGRRKLNFSAFDPGNEHMAHAAREASETVSEGEMPPRDYLVLHPEARLTPAERRAIARGFERMFGGRDTDDNPQRRP